VKLLITDFAFVEESYATKMKPVLSLLAVMTINTLRTGNLGEELLECFVPGVRRAEQCLKISRMGLSSAIPLI